MEAEKPRLAVSACLLGERVRFDGGHKYDDFINQSLARFFELLPVCPEAGVGLGVPRPPIRLVEQASGEIRAVGVKDARLEPSEVLRAYLDQVRGLVDSVCGYILKKGSPSCGMERVKVYRPDGTPAQRAGVGLFAERLMRDYPLLPVEEEGRLNDPGLRENFITRVLVYQRWRTLLQTGLTPARLVAFHTRHKLLAMAHNQAAYRRLGPLVARADTADGPAYFAELMRVLARRATPKSHANVLQHLMGYLKTALDSSDKAELLELIDTYRRGEVPLIVPVTLLKHHFRRHPHPYVADQVYLSPHPAELMLWNAV